MWMLTHRQNHRKTSNLLSNYSKGARTFNTFLKLKEWDKQIPTFTKLILDDQAKLIRTVGASSTL